MISDDLRHAVRALARRPGFLLLGVVALGLGLACTTLVFSMINTFLLRDPPGVHPTAALVEIGRGQGERGFDSSSYPDFLDLRVQASSLDRVFAYRIGTGLRAGCGGGAARAGATGERRLFRSARGARRTREPAGIAA
jgi:hypothetical protein